MWLPSLGLCPAAIEQIGRSRFEVATLMILVAPGLGRASRNEATA
jgi:hypothetical protein